MQVTRKDNYNFNVEFSPEEHQELLTLDDVEDSRRDSIAHDLQFRFLFHVLQRVGMPDCANNILRSPDYRTSNQI